VRSLGFDSLGLHVWLMVRSLGFDSLGLHVWLMENVSHGLFSVQAMSSYGEQMVRLPNGKA